MASNSPKLKRLTYGTLPENPRLDVHLLCENCLAFYSATRGDYFWAKPECSPRCGHCKRVLRLVRKVLTLELVTPHEAEGAKW